MSTESYFSPQIPVNINSKEYILGIGELCQGILQGINKQKLWITYDSFFQSSICRSLEDMSAFSVVHKFTGEF